MIGFRNVILLCALFKWGYSFSPIPFPTCIGNDFLPPPQNSEVPEVGLSAVELIQYYGYPVERHEVQTEDGYLLETHRIPFGRNSSNEINKPVVFFMHGIASSSADWVNMGPERTLPFILADLGYDVWLGNARGNMVSRRHVTLNPDKDRQFWDFSFHEIGFYDLPANIEYIYQETNQRSIYYIGHSQGTTTFFVMASTRPEYNERIRYMAAFGPVAFLFNMPNPIIHPIAYFYELIGAATKLIGIDELRNCRLLALLLTTLCEDGSPFQEFCMDGIFLLTGFDPVQQNRTKLSIFFTNVPAGNSIKQFLHFAQLIVSGYFRQYDYKAVKNFLSYNQISPPNYYLGAITAPVGLYYGANDWLVSVKDVERLQLELGNLVSSYLVPFPKFNHFDFVMAIDVVPLLYTRVLQDVGNY